MSETVKLEALEYHTHDGKEYQAGDTYEADAVAAENIVAQRKAKVVEDVATPKKKESHLVEPITTDSFKHEV